MTPARALLLLSLILAPFAIARAAEPEVKIENVRALALTADTKRPTSIFFDVQNNGEAPIQLIAADIPGLCGRAELHAHEKKGRILAMRKVDQIDISAHETRILKPMGPHIMCFDLKKDLKEGDTFDVILTFDPPRTTLRVSGRAQSMKQIMGEKAVPHHGL